MRNNTARVERELRAKEAFRLYSNRQSYVSIGNRLGISAPTVKRDVEWYIENRATREEIEHIDRRTSADIQHEKVVERRKKREAERNLWIRGVMKKLMGGKTIQQVADEEHRAVPTIYRSISNYEKVDPSFVAEYRRKARGHQFGRFIDPDDVQ